MNNIAVNIFNVHKTLLKILPWP